MNFPTRIRCLSGTILSGASSHKLRKIELVTDYVNTPPKLARDMLKGLTFDQLLIEARDTLKTIAILKTLWESLTPEQPHGDEVSSGVGNGTLSLDFADNDQWHYLAEVTKYIYMPERASYRHVPSPPDTGARLSFEN